MYSSALPKASKTRRGTALGRAKTVWSGFNRTKLTIVLQVSAEDRCILWLCATELIPPKQHTQKQKQKQKHFAHY
jgi:hypothetical protein